MSDRMRVPMAPKREAFLAADDVSASAVCTPTAVRFSLDVAEEMLAKIGPLAVEHFAERLATTIVYENQALVREAMLSYLRDRAWAEPLVKQYLREAIRDHVAAMMSSFEISTDEGRQR